MSHTCHRFWKCYKTLTFCSLWTRCRIPCHPPRKTTSEPSKVVRACRVSKHFDLEMCFAPQQRALFRHRNFQKAPKLVCFVKIWLGNVLRATTACTFSTSQLPKVVRPWRVLYIWLPNVLRAATACTFSYFFDISTPHGSAPALASLLSTLRSHKSLEKTQCSATLLPFRAPASSFFSLFLFSGLLSSALLFSDSSHLCFFHLSILSEVWLLNFLRLYISYSAYIPSQSDKVHILRYIQMQSDKYVVPEHYKDLDKYAWHIPAVGPATTYIKRHQNSAIWKDNISLCVQYSFHNLFRIYQ